MTVIDSVNTTSSNTKKTDNIEKTENGSVIFRTPLTGINNTSDQSEVYRKSCDSYFLPQQQPHYESPVNRKSYDSHSLPRPFNSESSLTLKRKLSDTDSSQNKRRSQASANAECASEKENSPPNQSNLFRAICNVQLGPSSIPSSPPLPLSTTTHIRKMGLEKSLFQNGFKPLQEAEYHSQKVLEQAVGDCLQGKLELDISDVLDRVLDAVDLQALTDRLNGQPSQPLSKITFRSDASNEIVKAWAQAFPSCEIFKGNNRIDRSVYDFSCASAGISISRNPDGSARISLNYQGLIDFINETSVSTTTRFAGPTTKGSHIIYGRHKPTDIRYGGNHRQFILDHASDKICQQVKKAQKWFKEEHEENMMSEPVGGGAEILPDSKTYVLKSAYESNVKVASDTLPLAEAAKSNSRNISRKVAGQTMEHLECAVRPKGSENDDRISDYPMLCIYTTPKGEKAMDSMGKSRLCQSVFTALLAYNLQKDGCPIPVLARPGFGSVVPTTADLGPGGIRIGFGLLPPKYISSVTETVKEFDSLMPHLETIMNTSSNAQNLIHSLNNYNAHEAHGNAVEAFFRIDFGKDDPSRRGNLIRDAIDRRDTFAAKPILWAKSPGDPGVQASETFDIADPGIEVDVPTRWSGKDKPTTFASQTSYFERSNSTGQSAGTDKSSILVSLRSFTVRSGMNAIQIVQQAVPLFFKMYDKSQASKDSKVELQPDSMVPGSNYPYFELPPAKLLNSAPAKENDASSINAFYYDASPYPRSGRSGEKIPPLGNRLINIVDVTNAETPQVRGLIADFEKLLKSERGSGVAPPRVLILVSSTSKWGSGGNLLAGQIQVVAQPGNELMFSTVVNYLTDPETVSLEERQLLSSMSEQNVGRTPTGEFIGIPRRAIEKS